MTSAKVKQDSNTEQKINVKYNTHVSEEGWKDPVTNGATSGSNELNYRVEAIVIELDESVPDAHIEYQAHVQDIGWQDWVRDGETAGTFWQSLRLEAINL